MHTRFRLFACLFLLLSTALAPAQVRIDYSTTLSASQAGGPSLVADAGMGRVWTVAADFRGSVLVRVDPWNDRIDRRIVINGLRLQSFLMLDNERLLVSGFADIDSLPHDPGLLLARSSPAQGSWLGTIGADGQIETGAYLQAGHEFTQLLSSGSDVVLLGNRYGAACLDSSSCLNVFVARTSADLRQVRYAFAPLGVARSYLTAATLARDQIFLAIDGGEELAASTEAAFASADAEYGNTSTGRGALTVMDAASGSVLRTTFTRSMAPTQLVFDAGRNAIWALASSIGGQLTTTSDALDDSCGEVGFACGPRSIICFAAGFCLTMASDATLTRFSADLRQLQFASYLGSNQADLPRALVLAGNGDLYASWGSTKLADPTGSGSINWVVLPKQGRAAVLEVPGAFQRPLGSVLPVATDGGNAIWSAAILSPGNPGPVPLIASSGLGACAPGDACVHLVRTQLPRGLPSVQTIPASSTLGLLVLLLGVAGLGQRRARLA